MADPSDRPTQPDRFPVVGIGASAGGLAAFTQFLKALPANSGMAFVLTQHLDPSFPSELTHILSSATTLPVTTARDGEPVAPDHVYVLPSDALLTISQGRLHLAPRTDGHPFAIDHFLISLGTDQGRNAIGIVLSGSGSDGAQGLQAIKAAGGITFAQEPGTAEHGDMPRRAIETGMVDHILPPGELAAAVVDPSRRASSSAAEPPQSPPTTESEMEALEEIKHILRNATGTDFRHYKSGTLRRRIERRIAHHHLDDLPGYLALLRRDAGEVSALYRDVLLHVTGYFRDPAALTFLKDHILPDLFIKRAGDAPLRIWVPGCASGEEVYTSGSTVRWVKAR